MRESGYSEDLIYDFDGMIAELVMYIDAKMQERVEKPAPIRKKDPTIQVLKYDNINDVFQEIEANIEERETLGQEGIAAMANVDQRESIAEMILDELPVKF